MTKTNQNARIFTGEDKNLVFTITDSTGASVDMAGASAWWIMQDETSSGSILLLKTGGSGVTVSGSTVTVAVPGSLTGGCSLSGTYFHQLSASDTSDQVSVLSEGVITFDRRLY